MLSVHTPSRVPSSFKVLAHSSKEQLQSGIEMLVLKDSVVKPVIRETREMCSVIH